MWKMFVTEDPRLEMSHYMPGSKLCQSDHPNTLPNEPTSAERTDSLAGFTYCTIAPGWTSKFLHPEPKASFIAERTPNEAH
jgi:hypothetical protein